MIVDDATGTVAESGVELVPLDLTALDEDELLELFPTPRNAQAHC